MTYFETELRDLLFSNRQAVQNLEHLPETRQRDLMMQEIKRIKRQAASLRREKSRLKNENENLRQMSFI